ncbi:MAG: hypothetical protein ABSC11_10335 [Smithella sp.]|jgi:hypothetical protein
MNGTVRYCVVKKYKGKLKREPAYTHLLFVPIDPQQYMYLGLIGKDLDDVPNTYAAQLLIKLPEEITEKTIQGEHEYFGKNFIEVEALNCTSSNPSQGKYNISIPQKGTYIKSDLEIEYQLELSTVDRKIYILKGEINIVSGNVTEEDFDHRPLIDE